jgi:hypothetical protein
MEPINVRFQQLSFELWMQPIDETEGFVSLNENLSGFRKSANFLKFASTRQKFKEFL